ncbi:HTH myb-type domain-containing protein [Chloropicon primus]|uniref:Uncharacterized protein n=2 Tax=Chloropicon primus TaxID=1764295 RepID=A0A5B8MG83_9CHLO|nr:hypothetical protein A3770_01p08600 [Chloropicon primus]UPQ97553.1 HTH myb-type domain-containing protein [Chloropicon primus]|eukprot:QDZ18342.1 hypothetical protein A3770_01p08600 [Chloropicon primus]
MDVKWNTKGPQQVWSPFDGLDVGSGTTFDELLESHKFGKGKDNSLQSAHAQVVVVAKRPPQSSKAKGRTAKSSRYWTKEERTCFEAALKLHKNDYNEVSKHVGSRTPAQVRSHARKYYKKLIRDYKKKRKEMQGSAKQSQGGGGEVRFDRDPIEHHHQAASPTSTFFDPNEAFVDARASYSPPAGQPTQENFLNCFFPLAPLDHHCVPATPAQEFPAAYPSHLLDDGCEDSLVVHHNGEMIDVDTVLDFFGGFEDIT